MSMFGSRRKTNVGFAANIALNSALGLLLNNTSTRVVLSNSALTLMLTRCGDNTLLAITNGYVETKDGKSEVRLSDEHDKNFNRAFAGLISDYNRDAKAEFELSIVVVSALVEKLHSSSYITLCRLVRQNPKTKVRVVKRGT